MPGTLRSSVYLPPPLVLSAASTLAVGWPMMEKSLILLLSLRLLLSFRAKRGICFSVGSSSSLGRHPLLLRRNRRFNRAIHLAVSRTAAQIAAQSGANLGFRRIRILGQERLHRHHESRSAKAALRSAPVTVGLLNRRQTAVLAHALYGRDLLLLTTRRQQRA